MLSCISTHISDKTGLITADVDFRFSTNANYGRVSRNGTEVFEGYLKDAKKAYLDEVSRLRKILEK